MGDGEVLSEQQFLALAVSTEHTFIIYMNGKVARVAHNAKPEPGCEIFVPSKAERDPRMLSQTLSIATSVASFANIIK